MIRTVVGLLFILATAAAVAEFGNCAKDISLVEYVKVKGTQNLTFEAQGKVDITLYSTFPLTGERYIGYHLAEYPGYLESIAAEVHTGGYDAEGFPHLFPQVTRTNQLIPSKFAFSQTGYETKQQYRAVSPINVMDVLALAPETDVRNWVLSLQITTVMPNGRPHKLWAEGTQFQQFKWGSSQDKIQHNGFVVENPCEIPVEELCHPFNSYVQREDGTYLIDSGLPATFPHPADSSCEWDVSPIVPSASKKDLSLSNFGIVVTYANLGSNGALSFSVAQPFENVVALGGAITTAEYFEFPAFPRTVYRTGSDADTGAVFGFRARIVPLDLPIGSCFKVEQSFGADAACLRADINACVVQTRRSCATLYDADCVAAADLCEAFYDANLQDLYGSNTWSPDASKRSTSSAPDLNRFPAYAALVAAKNNK